MALNRFRHLRRLANNLIAGVLISGSNLSANSIRHESALIQGHYGDYVVAQSLSANNVGLVYETAVIYGTLSSLESSTASVIAQKHNDINTAMGVDP